MLRGAYVISVLSCFVSCSAGALAPALKDIDDDHAGVGVKIIDDDVNGGDDAIEGLVLRDVNSPHNEDANHDDPSSPALHSANVVEDAIAREYIRRERFDVEEEVQQQQQQQQQQQVEYTPPTFFRIAAHVQTNLHTGYSYFLPLHASFAHLPFLECGAVGSTTESLPLVSGVFRHVPHTVIPKRDESAAAILSVDIILDDDEENNGIRGNEKSNKDDEAAGVADANDSVDDFPKRPSPPKYVVALSSMEITVGGNGNETQKFVAGDVIFIEDAWWGIWDDNDEFNSPSKAADAFDDVTLEEVSSEGAKHGKNSNRVNTMKGYIMRASSQSQTDLHVLMLTVPNAVHRHWKNAQYVAATTRMDDTEEKEKRPRSTVNTEIGTRHPWWKQPPSTFLPLRNFEQNYQRLKPCTLETDPTFSHPSAMSSATLSQHFTQHFTSLLRRSANPIPSFLPHHHHRDLIMHILAQMTAAAFGGTMTLALVLQLWRIIPGPVAVGFGSACLVVLGTWGFVWLGEEISDQWELWREKNRLDRMMSQGWGTGVSGGIGDGR
ncbi:hypothetical protein ACHAXA_007060 [Cyclostephanos tholiformis]|uniref:Uncharacterized protein n=1 Tax=Cyclostephanos tholiformis TaxID=382380 RepID=A0ABD3R6A3_9STRA